MKIAGRSVLWFVAAGLIALTLASGRVCAQSQQSPNQDSSQKQPEKTQSEKKAQDQSQNPSNIPDAPSATRPAQTLPSAPSEGLPLPPSALEPGASTNPPAPVPPAPLPSVPANAPAPGEGPPPEPPLNIKTVPEGGATQESPDSRQQLYRLYVNTNQVIVPVTVKDQSGHMVNGLSPDDFSVFENGVRQKMNFFTQDPFALSAAVIIDLGLPDADLQKVNRTFGALEGAFSQFDEISLYTYSQSVSRVTNFAGVGQRLTAALNDLELVRGRNNGPPTVDGPFGPQGPTINNIPVNPNVPRVITPPKQIHVLNDAILRAALDLGKQDKTRRKVIFVISDGRESGSEASYSDVLRVLLTNGVLVYSVAVGSSAIPVYGRLEKLHLPFTAYGNILPKYVSATGGEMLDGYSRSGMEDAYARIMGDARNQYTLGYLAHGMGTSYRQIVVDVNRPDLMVYAKDGYYALPPQRRQ